MGAHFSSVSSIMGGIRYFSSVYDSKKEEIEKESIVTNVRSKGNSVILDFHFTKAQFEKPTEQRLENVIETLLKSQIEKWEEKYAKGFMDVMQKSKTHPCAE